MSIMEFPNILGFDKYESKVSDLRPKLLSLLNEYVNELKEVLPPNMSEENFLEGVRRQVIIEIIMNFPKNAEINLFNIINTLSGLIGFTLTFSEFVGDNSYEKIKEFLIKVVNDPNIINKSLSQHNIH